MVSRLLAQVEQSGAGSWPALRELLHHLEEDGGLTTAPAGEVRRRCSRLVAAVTDWWADPNVLLAREDYQPLAPYAVTLAHVAYLSDQAGTDALLGPVLARCTPTTGGGLTFADDSDRHKFLLACSLASPSFDHLITLAVQQPREFFLPLLRAYDLQLTATPEVQSRRQRLLEATPHLTEVVPSTRSLDSLHHLWALCSYVTTADRHQAKRPINQMFRNWLLARGLGPREPDSRPPPAARPTVLVACEVLDQGHVMHRCFGPSLEQLRRRFRVIGLVAQDGLGEGGRDWCDDLLIFDGRGLPLQAVVDRIGQLRPDIIYYPCLGMRLWTVLLANLRLAPVQLATLGHPATTHSPQIDAVVIGRDLLGEPACFSERLVRLRGPGHPYRLRPDDDAMLPDVRERPDPLRLAVCGNLHKLNADFLAACRAIAARSSRPVAFHMFPNTVGLRYHVTCRQLEAALPGVAVTVYRRAPWATYRLHLHSCDVCLGPFPFGGENSALDAVLHGLPLVTLEGPEPHGRLDARVARLAGLPDWLITHSPAEYEEAALRLIGDDGLRCTLSRHLDPRELRRRVEREAARYTTDFVDTVWWVWENRERLARPGEQVLEPAGPPGRNEA